jgi:hypothetical protein
MAEWNKEDNARYKRYRNSEKNYIEILEMKSIAQ